MMVRGEHDSTSGRGDLVVILGAGYTGRYVHEAASRQNRRVVATSRTPDSNLAHIPAEHRLPFDLARRETWPGLPRDASYVWCFPAVPLEAVKAFASEALSHARRIIVLGSTSAYDLARAPDAAAAPEIAEDAPLAMDKPRVQGEEYLRRHHGAIVLRVAGIYGPGRNVLNWIRQGRVTASERYVNLIHVEDLAGICLAALERGTPGEAYNVSDGTPRRWSDICREAEQRWGITARPAGADRGPGKRIVIEKLETRLGYTFKHPDLYQALSDIEASGKGCFKF